MIKNYKTIAPEYEIIIIEQNGSNQLENIIEDEYKCKYLHVKYNSKKYELEKRKDKKYLTIDGIKNEREKVAIEVEKLENMDEENSKGRILDAKK